MLHFEILININFTNQLIFCYNLNGGSKMAFISQELINEIIQINPEQDKEEWIKYYSRNSTTLFQLN